MSIAPAEHISMLAPVLRKRLEPSRGQRPGRPSDPAWVLQRKVSMSEQTYHQLEALAHQVSNHERKVSTMQVAALLLERAVAQHNDQDQS